MAKESVNILKDKIDIVDLLAQLNAALSEEWLAFYQYWVGSFVVEGAMRGDVQREFQDMQPRIVTMQNYWPTVSLNWKVYPYLTLNNGLI